MSSLTVVAFSCTLTAGGSSSAASAAVGTIASYEAPAAIAPKGIDADDTDDDDDDDDDEDEDDDDETELLMRELEKIKRERAADAAAKEAAAADAAEKERTEAVLKGNPLVNPMASSSSKTGGDYSLKRRWDDDVVFKNQTRNEPETKRRFINDTVRNDFHRRFLEKYVR